MLAFELKSGEVMIELCRGPACFGMTGRTVLAKAPFMRLILLMAGIAILRGVRKIRQIARIEMTPVTCKICMATLKCKRILIMVEFFPKAIHTIVTIQAGCSIDQGMACHESYILLAVTAITSAGIKFADIVRVAVLAGKRFARRRELVTA